MAPTKQQITTFQEKILTWYKKNKRDLPWRRDRDPYHILVSEIMLQQTQATRVVPKYHEWLQRFPTLKSLADAKTSEVLLHWSGLGYNSRGLRLQKAAKIITDEHKGEFPKTYEVLMRLPGVGKYTANALLCFAFDEQVAVVDTNVRKVIVTEFGITEEKQIEKVAREILPNGKAYDWNQALMDYASGVLKDKKIIVKKQTPFRSSNRYYRGHTMKLLVKKQSLSFSDLIEYFSKDNPVERDRLEEILKRMEKDGLLKITRSKISIV